MIRIETYTIENSSNMQVIDYYDIPLEEIAQDLVDTVKGWDYAVAWVDGDDEILGTIYRDQEGFEIER